MYGNDAFILKDWGRKCFAVVAADTRLPVSSSSACFFSGFSTKSNEMASTVDGNKLPLRRKREDGEDDENVGVKRDRSEASRYRHCPQRASHLLSLPYCQQNSTSQ